jgi:hypothetical protein
MIKSEKIERKNIVWIEYHLTSPAKAWLCKDIISGLRVIGVSKEKPFKMHNLNSLSQFEVTLKEL